MRIEQVAILDEQQALDNDQGDRTEIGKGVFGIVRPVEPVSIAVEQPHPRARLFSPSIA
jgi:hypothetical protein